MGSTAAEPSTQGAPPGAVARLAPGLGLAAAGTALAFALHTVLPAAPWLSLSLLLGVVIGSIPAARRHLSGVASAGLTLASKRLLRLGIVLLGLKLSLSAIADLGAIAILAIMALVGVNFGITWLIAKAFRLPGDEPLLMAAGFSICGVSAIGAVSAARGSSARDTATPVTMVTLFGTAAIVVLPALAPLVGVDSTGFGYWVGASVHDVGQVVATAQSAGTVALAAAVVVKLTRVLTLAPIVAIVAAVTRRRAPAGAARPPLVPLFVLGFVAMIVVRSFVPVTDTVLQAADLVQSVLIGMALFAIGASLRLETLVRSGWRAAAAGLSAWTGILALSLGFVHLIG